MMPLSNDVWMSSVSAGICADVFFTSAVGRGSKEYMYVVGLVDLIIFPTSVSLVSSK